MAMQRKTLEIIYQAREILEAGHPMTVRQVFYQLVSKQVIENNKGRYNAVSRALVNARRQDIIPWEWIEDRLRRPRIVGMWKGLPAFAETCRKAYRLDVWETQPDYFEVWLEKDALSGIFEDELNPYGVTLNVGRGFDGWDSIRNAAERYKICEKPITVLYFGDFDPSGEDMVRSLKERLDDRGSRPDLIKCALTLDDIQLYNLPIDFTKKTDTRSRKHIEKYGDISVELDALPVDVLRARLVEEVRARMDLDALGEVLEREEIDRAELVRRLGAKED